METTRRSCVHFVADRGAVLYGASQKRQLGERHSGA